MAPTEENSMEKLTADNYLGWTFDMKFILAGKDLWDIVEGTEVIEDDFTEKQMRKSRIQEFMSPSKGLS